MRNVLLIGSHIRYCSTASNLIAGIITIIFCVLLRTGKNVILKLINIKKFSIKQKG